MVNQGKVITGNEGVNLSLTVDEVSFIVSGLRDCAVQLVVLLPDGDAEVMRDRQEMIDENRTLADKLEREMLVQVTDFMEVKETKEG